MKILYVTNYSDIAKASGGFINDYQNDLLFYGLRELFGDDVVDSTQIPTLYKEYEGRIPQQNIWGGMTSFYLIGDNNIDRINIEQKIKDALNAQLPKRKDGGLAPAPSGGDTVQSEDEDEDDESLEFFKKLAAK
jgi:hypothetical protein